MDLQHQHHQTWLHHLERALYLFYKRENHTVANYLVLNVIIGGGILVMLFIAELFFKY